MADIEITRGETVAWSVQLYQADGVTVLGAITGYQAIWAKLAENADTDTYALERSVAAGTIEVVSEGDGSTTPPEIKILLTAEESAALPVGELLLGIWWTDADGQHIAIRPMLTVVVHEGVGEP